MQRPVFTPHDGPLLKGAAACAMRRPPTVSQALSMAAGQPGLFDWPRRPGAHR
jgi:hypothetical protein